MSFALWPHQEAAIEFADERRATALDMWMGTGKTRVAVHLAERWNAKRTLVVAPLCVLPSWAEQFERYGDPDREVVVLDRGSVAKKLERAHLALRSGRPTAIAINYESVWRDPFGKWARNAGAAGWDAVIWDEAHKLKSARSTVSLYAYKVQARRRLGLSGTWMPHSPLDTFGEYRALDPGVLGLRFTEFRARYAILAGPDRKWVKGFQNLDELRSRIAPITFQAGKEVLSGLPECLDESMYVELGRSGRKIYDEMDRELVVQLESGELTAANGLVRLLRLQQITGGSVQPDHGGAYETVDTAKQRALETILEGLDDEEPVVVFARFHADLDAIHHVASRLRRRSCELSGRVKATPEEWASAPVLACQITAGGIGINWMTRARVGVFYSPGLSLGDYLQAHERLHRPGQERPVVFYHLIARATRDEAVWRGIRARRNLIEEVLADLASARRA